MELLFLNILLVGAGLVLWLLIRALPRMDAGAPREKDWFERWLTSELPGKIDAFVSTFWVRSLRRFKVWVLRVDNNINEKLRMMKFESSEGIKGEKINLKKVVKERAAKVASAEKGEN